MRRGEARAAVITCVVAMIRRIRISTRREYAEAERGMKLSSRALEPVGGGAAVQCSTEEEIFAALGLEYRHPHERCC
jgi:DNA polymerase/3'-5' exonuclease PolX